MDNFAGEPRMHLGGVDWEEAWERYQDLRPAPDDAVRWSERSASFGSRTDGAYERQFLQLADVRPGERVLDMGCGVGLLAVPLAKQGCQVLCADFSPAMLERTQAAAEEAGVADRIETKLLAWDDDWEAAGVGADVVDVAIASRSMATYHLTDAIEKLDRAAARRACVTLASGRSPCRDERVYQAVGRPQPSTPDYAFALNILFEHGVYPELTYVVTHKRPAFRDRAAALADFTRMVGDDLSAKETAALEAFLDAHYADNPAAVPDRRFESDEQRTTRWAFISWGRED